MFSLDIESDSGSKDVLIAELWEQGSTGVVELERPDGRVTLRAFFDDTRDAAALQSRFGGTLARHDDRDWVAHSRALWRPFEVGSRFFIVPEWMDDPAPAGRLRIEVNPGIAFGTGFHEATQICLEALEQYLAPGMTTLDAGAGSGILSIAAKLLGARRAIACDVDAEATPIAAANFRRAGVDALLFTGSVDAVRSGAADLILANISAAASIALAPELLRCLAPAGRCVAGGFEADEIDSVAEAIARAGARIEDTRAKKTWRALVFTRRSYPPERSGSTPA
jgi:ribosomal protein L11 methyltransferase